MSAKKRADRTYGDEQLQTLQRNTFRYFWEETNPDNGLIPDHTSAADVPASIAGVGFALASYPVGAERLFVSRARAVYAKGRVVDAKRAREIIDTAIGR